MRPARRSGWVWAACCAQVELSAQAAKQAVLKLRGLGVRAQARRRGTSLLFSVSGFFFVPVSPAWRDEARRVGDSKLAWGLSGPAKCALVLAGGSSWLVGVGGLVAWLQWTAAKGRLMKSQDERPKRKKERGNLVGGHSPTQENRGARCAQENR